MSRKPGTLSLYTCCVCGTKERARGGNHAYRCVACKDSGLEHRSRTAIKAYRKGAATAHGIVSSAITAGEIPHPKDCVCADCGAPAAEYDHRDYNAPMAIEPVCRPCNRRRGHAIPRHGYIADSIARGEAPYRIKVRVQRFFADLGITSASLEAASKYLTVSDWRHISADVSRQKDFAHLVAHADKLAGIDLSAARSLGRQKEAA